MFIFPRVNYKDHFIRGGPPGCVGKSNKSGWMQGDQFLEFMQHFVNHVRPAQEKKVLILLDNHESHLYLPVIDYCRENGVVMLSFPPHCSHKLQPLDRSVFGPFKKLINQEMDSWIKSNPGKRFTIYDLPSVTSNALVNSATPKNIINGFSVSGVSPFNRNVFNDDEYAPSTVTNIVLDSTDNMQPYEISDNTETVMANKIIETLSQEPITISPESIRPYPKAQLAQKMAKKGGRNQGTTKILTDTSEKNEIEQNANKKNNIAKLKLLYTEARKNKQTSKATKKNKNKIVDENDEDDDAFCTVCSELYSKSKSGESWIQCHRCKL